MAILRSALISPLRLNTVDVHKVSKWPISNKGLLHDREWMIIKPSGNCLSQKEEPRLCLIRPHVDLNKATLTLNAEG